MTAAAGISPAWFTSRAAGITALLLCSISVALGLAKTTGSASARVGGVSLRQLHEALALGAIAMIAVHGFALLADPYLKPGLAGVAVPFAAGYRPLATALGQIAAYGIVALAVSFYWRRAIGTARWRSAHALIPAFWLMALVHGLALGTDRGAWWFLVAIGLPTAAAIVLLAVRIDAATTATVAQSEPQHGQRWETGEQHGESGARDGGRSSLPAPHPSLWS